MTPDMNERLISPGAESNYAQQQIATTLGTRLLGAFVDNEDEAAWRAQANCISVGPGMLFPIKRSGKEVEIAKRICDGCTVKPECLNYALDNGEEHGIWGGMSELERKILSKGRARESN